MPILNYTTSVPVDRTMMQIQKILVKHGATNISTDYIDGQPASMMFLIDISGQWISYRLPCRHGRVFRILERDPRVQPRYRTEEHALRVSWRIVKDWIEAQMALIEAELASLPEVFLPYVVTNDGRTVADRFLENPQLLLNTPSDAPPNTEEA